MIRIILFAIAVMFASSCNRDDVIVTALPPEIILDSETGIYSVKTGREITISPEYKNVENAVYRWVSDGKTLSEEPQLTYISDKAEEIYVTLTVETESGSDSEEVKIEILEREIPEISLADHEKGYRILAGNSLKFSPSVKETSLPTTCRWTSGDKVLSEEKEYTFREEEIGKYELTFSAENEDGKAEIHISVEVCSADMMPFSWKFRQTEFSYAKGRRVLIAPYETENAGEASFRWESEGKILQEGKECRWICDLDEEGRHIVTATAYLEKEDGHISVAQEFTINVCPEEGHYFRAKNGSSAAGQDRILSYMPGPGQHINETVTGGFDGSETTAEAAVSYAEKRLEQQTWVSLGAFGGYIVAGFDHSIENSGSYDFAVLGNAYKGASEPGIIWVMQDENGNGLADDTWYELKGSESGKAETLQDYAVTYYRPAAPGMPVQWKDNRGQSGEVDYLKQFHKQDYYYPAWVSEDSYTLFGTALEPRNYDQSGIGTFWVNDDYDWGYADNFSVIDGLSDKPNPGASARANHFRISDATDFEGRPANLKYIDFVKVQTGVNSKSGWLGEISTEVMGFYDYSMKKD